MEIDNTVTNHPLNGDGRFITLFECTGNLTLKLTPVTGTPTADLYLAYSFGDSEFTNFFLEDGFGGYLGTVGELGTSPYVITVGALTSRYHPYSFMSFDMGKIAFFSSRGPTRDGRIKPDITAPGYFVLGPLAGSTDEYILMAGTSMTTPIVAGLVALLLETNPNLDVFEVRNILTSQALSDGFTGSLPNNIYGYGKAFLSFTSDAPGGSDGGSSGGGGGCSMAQGGYALSPLLVFFGFVLVRRLIRR
ncbi:S8 family serine peptidase [Thermocrinis sp.]